MNAEQRREEIGRAAILGRMVDELLRSIREGLFRDAKVSPDAVADVVKDIEEAQTAFATLREENRREIERAKERASA